MSLPEIDNKIFDIRGQRVMLDFDLAQLYEVETKRINEQVRRNTDKFPEDFMFRLTVSEWELMRSHLKKVRCRRKMRPHHKIKETLK